MSLVYFIQSGPGGPIKIGITSGYPERRLCSLQSGNPVPLHLVATVPGAQKLEAQLHQQFEVGRIQGEWFKPDTPGLAHLLASIIEEGRLPEWFTGLEDKPLRRGCTTCPWWMEAELWERGFDRCWTCLNEASQPAFVPGTSEEDAQNAC